MAKSLTSISMYLLSGLTSFLNFLIMITNPIGNRLKIDVLLRMLYFCISRSIIKLNSMLLSRAVFCALPSPFSELQNNSLISTMILSIYGLIKWLNTEIKQCLLKHFAKPGFLIFFSCLTRTVNYTYAMKWRQHFT